MKKRFGGIVTVPFWGVHIAAVVGPFLVGFSWKGVALAIAFYYIRMFGVTGAYHRYFSHRTYRTSRAFQFFLAVLAQSSVQKGALWWAAHHRGHHEHSDTPLDPHSFKDFGFYYSHVGWIVSSETEDTHWSRIKDLSRYPELVWLNKWHAVPGIAFAVAMYFIGGLFMPASTALVYGFFVSTVMLWHGTFTINSLSHIFGKRRYATTDESKNNPILAIVTMGEGWHNNHHYYPRSVRQGFFWWEIDMTFYILKALSYVGLVWDLHVPNEKVRRGEYQIVGKKKPTPGLIEAAPADDLVAPAMLGDAE